MDVKRKVVVLSSLFKWYASDFGETIKERLHWLLPYLSSDQQAAVRSLLQSDEQYIEIKYSPYDWSLNGM